MPTGNHNDVRKKHIGLFAPIEDVIVPINKVVQQAHRHDISETTFQAYVYRVNVSSDYTALPGKHSATRHALMQDGTMDEQYINVYAYPDDPNLGGGSWVQPKGPDDGARIAQLPVFIVAKGHGLPIPIPGSVIEVQFDNKDDMGRGGKYISLVTRGIGFPKINKKSNGQLEQKASSGGFTSISNPSSLTLGFS
jgi:hypothetical protein